MTLEKSEAFTNQIEKHKGIIYKIANSYCHNSEDRKDLLQEIVLQLWRSFDNYNEQYRQSTWVYRIALNVAISFYRKEKVRKRISTSYPEELFNMPDIETKSHPSEAVLLLQQFISELKDLDKALMLLYLEEKTYKEMAAIIGITETNVATKVSRIKSLLKQKYSKTK